MRLYDDVLTLLPKGTILDIEEGGGWSNSSDSDAQAFYAENHDEFDVAVLNGKANERREKQDVIAERAQKSLKRHSACLRIAKTSHDIVRCLEDMKHTHANPFNLIGVGVYARCVYYLWRIGPLEGK